MKVLNGCYKRWGHRVLLLIGLSIIGSLSMGVISPEDLEANKPTLAISKSDSTLTIDWESQPGVYYFMEGSPDLKTWITAKLLTDVDQEGDLSLGTTISGTKGFYRLSLEGDPASRRLRADDDGDRIINLMEANLGEDAFEAPAYEDVDNDGLPDYWERFYYTDLSRDGSYIDVEGGVDLATAYEHALIPFLTNSDGDEWTDLEELALGFDPNYDQSRDDSSFSRDGDQDTDGFDNLTEFVNQTDGANPNSTPPEVPRYAVIDLEPRSNGTPRFVSDAGVVLLDDYLTARRWSFDNGLQTLSPAGATWVSDMNRHGVVVGGITNEDYNSYYAAGDETLAAYWPTDQTQAVTVQNQNSPAGLEYTDANIRTVNGNDSFLGRKMIGLNSPTVTGSWLLSAAGNLSDGFTGRLDSAVAVDVIVSYPHSGVDSSVASTTLSGYVFEPKDMNLSGQWIGSARQYIPPENYVVYPDRTSSYDNPPDRYVDILNGAEIPFSPLRINDGGIILGRSGTSYGYSINGGTLQTLPKSGSLRGISNPDAGTEPLRMISEQGLFQQRAHDTEGASYAAVTHTTEFDFWSLNNMVNAETSEANAWSNLIGTGISSNGDFIIATGTNSSGQSRSLLLLKVDLDIVHPATGELDEAREDADTGSGIVAVKRDDETPVTELKIHAADSLPAGSKVKLLFVNGSGEGTRYRIWKNADFTDEIISSTTELDATIEHTLYIEGLKKSTGGESSEKITQIYDVGSTAFEGDSVQFTVVEAEFDVWLNLFIPMQWTDLPALHPVHVDVINAPGNPTTEYNRKIAHGDFRLFNNIFLDDPANEVDEGPLSSRVHMRLTTIPFGELDADGIKDGSYVRFIGESYNFDKSESVPFPDQGYSTSNLLVSDPEISDQARGGASGIDSPADSIQWIDSGNRSVRFRLRGSATNPVVTPAPAIDWDFEVGVLVSGVNITNPKWKIFGHVQDGFPAYEIYVRDSDGNSGDERGTAMYQYNPLDFGRDPSDLFDEGWFFADEDETVLVDEGSIQ